jgi:fimbrial chaperone protein
MGSQSVRVGAMIPAADTERTYRLLFSQLKPFREPVSEENGNAIVSLLTNLDVAIYVEPAHAAPLGKIESIALNNGTLSFAVSNRGTTHLSIRSLRVEGFGTGKQPVLTRVTNGEVVFAGGVRDFQLKLPAADCAKISTLRVSAEIDKDITLGDKLEVNASSCGGGSGGELRAFP